MRLPINPVTVDDATCVEAEVSVAVSNSVAIRVVPVDAEGVEHPDGAVGVVGTADTDDIAVFLAVVGEATAALLAHRGV